MPGWYFTVPDLLSDSGNNILFFCATSYLSSKYNFPYLLWTTTRSPLLFPVTRCNTSTATMPVRAVMWGCIWYKGSLRTRVLEPNTQAQHLFPFQPLADSAPQQVSRGMTISAPHEACSLQGSQTTTFSSF